MKNTRKNDRDIIQLKIDAKQAIGIDPGTERLYENIK